MISPATCPAAPGAFLAALNNLLQGDALANRDVSCWHQVLSVMRGDLLPDLPGAAVAAAEDLWQQARVLVGETAAQARAYQRFRAEQDSRLLGDFSQRIQTASDRNALWRTLAADLPTLGVTACYVALYETPLGPNGPARLLFACEGDRPHDLDRELAVFPASQLLPAALLSANAPRSLVALPLYFQHNQLGFLMLGLDGRGAAFSETFREQISSALAGLFLREDIRHAWQEAEEANRLKSRFLATVSHELRTPLSLIVGTTDMLQREGITDTVRFESYQKDLGRIRTSAQHLSRLIGDVLDLASSQVGELRLSCEPLHVETLLRRVALLGETLALEKRLVWAAEIPNDLPLVWGNRTRLQQVILNLISNAVKFTDQGFISLWAETGRDQVMVAVSDTGIGIPLAEQDVIFDEFRQSERSSRRGYGGMGLGLAVSKRLVELHGGCIGVISSGTDGTGSTFFFTLPILRHTEGSKPVADHRSGTVLLLTEQAASGVRLQERLLQRGYAVETLAMAEKPDWLSQVLSAPPGAIVLDLEPAAEQGWELMQTLKLNPATCEIPVLFYTLADEGGMGSLLALDYLAKPVSGAALAHTLERQGVTGNPRKRPTILVVEDDPGIQDLHVRIARSHVPGCRVLRASNGAEALAAMAASVPDLVLLDLMMPQVDGFTVLARMREDQRTRSVPVIVLTAQTLTREDMARLQQGVTAVLGKELFTEAEVLNQVESALARSKQLGGEAQRIARLAMTYIHEHFAETISREGLAAEVGVSERHLTLCFRQETGITPVVYLNRCRIRQARSLLETTSMNVTEGRDGVRLWRQHLLRQGLPAGGWPFAAHLPAGTACVKRSAFKAPTIESNLTGSRSKITRNRGQDARE